VTDTDLAARYAALHAAADAYFNAATNRKATAAAPALRAALKHTPTPPASDAAVPARPVMRMEVIREWVGGERYARDYEYCDATFKDQADRVLALFAAAPKVASDTGTDVAGMKRLFKIGAETGRVISRLDIIEACETAAKIAEGYQFYEASDYPVCRSIAAECRLIPAKMWAETPAPPAEDV
jgi:hypothetical protein